MKKLLQVLFGLVLFVLLFGVYGYGQVQNMQAASGTNGDLTKPTLGFNLASGQTLNVKTGAIISGAGSYDFTSGTKLVLPNSAAPTTTAFGWTAADNNAWAASRGAVQFFDGTANTYLVGALVSDTPTNGQVPTWNTGGTITWETPATGGVALGDSPTWTGIHTWTPAARSSGVLPYLTYNAPADTAQTAGTEAIGISYLGATRQHASNTSITSQREVVFAAPTYSFASATGTITNAATVAITAAPIVGTNAAITNPYALWLQAGSLGFGASGSIGSISQSSGLLSVNSVAGLNLRPSTGSNGPLSIAGASMDVVVSDDTANPTWKGAAVTSRGMYLQRAATAFATYHALALGATAQSGLESDLATGTYASTTATDSGASMRMSMRTYGGTTWVNNALIAMFTTQTQSETARGSEIRFYTSINSGTTLSQQATIGNDGSMKLLNPTGGLGYGTGAGGAVTQASSRTTGVTLSKVCGAITLVSAAGSATPQTFTVTNTTVAANDTIVVNQQSGTDLYEIFVTNVGSGSFKITFFTTGGTTTEQPVFNFAVIKAVNS